MNLIIDSTVRDVVAQYLASRPWGEVHQIMPVLINLPIAPDLQLAPAAETQRVTPPVAEVGPADHAPAVPQDEAGEAQSEQA